MLKIRTNLLIFAIDQSQFKTVFCGVDVEHSWPALTIQAVHTVTSHSCHIDGQIQRADYTMISAKKIKKCNINY